MIHNGEPYLIDFDHSRCKVLYKNVVFNTFSRLKMNKSVVLSMFYGLLTIFYVYSKISYNSRYEKGPVYEIVKTVFCGALNSIASVQRMASIIAFWLTTDEHLLEKYTFDQLRRKKKIECKHVYVWSTILKKDKLPCRSKTTKARSSIFWMRSKRRKTQANAHGYSRAISKRSEKPTMENVPLTESNTSIKSTIARRD